MSHRRHKASISCLFLVGNHLSSSSSVSKNPGCSVCWWSLCLWKDWMGICNKNGIRHTRTVLPQKFYVL
uniref:Secreted protein n=1 Tax=Brassica oleracea TaxID=3712 RepID=A0A3P6DL64_BRAOL|nr:unnamed protein product [Brassica oleracea]